MNRLVARSPGQNRLAFPADRFGGLFENFLQPSDWYEENVREDLIPAMDVKERDNEYVIHAELPGVKKEDIDVTIENGVLTISGESRSESEEKEGERIVRSERRYGKYVRTMRVGSQIDEPNIKAKYKDGILELTLPKAEEVKPKKISVDLD